MTRRLTIAIFLMLISLVPVQAQDHREEAEAFMGQLVKSYFARGNFMPRMHLDSLVVIGPGRVFIHRQSPSHLGDTIVPGSLLQTWIRPLKGGAKPGEVLVFPYSVFIEKGNPSIATALGDANAFTTVLDALAGAHSYFTEDDFLLIAKADGKPLPVIARRNAAGWKIAGVFLLDPSVVYKDID